MPAPTLPLQFQKVDIAATGAVIPAVTGQVIRVYAWELTSVDTKTVTPGDGTNNFSGARTCIAGVAWVGDELASGHPRWTSVSGGSLTLTLSASTQLSGGIWYTQA